jgi:hypothetical protein
MNGTLKTAEQLKRATESIRSTALTDTQVLEHVIKLYGDEFIKANDEITRLRAANDELFRTKQKVVIANRELITKVDELEKMLQRAAGAIKRSAEDSPKH